MQLAENCLDASSADRLFSGRLLAPSHIIQWARSRGRAGPCDGGYVPVKAVDDPASEGALCQQGGGPTDREYHRQLSPTLTPAFHEETA